MALQGVVLNRRRLGLGAITGSVYYLTSSSCSASEMYTKCCRVLSSCLAKVGTVNVIIISLILLARYSRLSALSPVSANQVWISAIVNCVFFTLKFVLFWKTLVTSARNVIRLRKLAIIDLKSKQSTLPGECDRRRDLIQHMNNVCIICLEPLSDVPLHEAGEQKLVLLECGHVYHYGCFRVWFLGAGTCPYCRKKV